MDIHPFLSSKANYMKIMGIFPIRPFIAAGASEVRVCVHACAHEECIHIPYTYNIHIHVYRSSDGMRRHGPLGSCVRGLTCMTVFVRESENIVL